MPRQEEHSRAPIVVEESCVLNNSAQETLEEVVQQTMCLSGKSFDFLAETSLARKLQSGIEKSTMELSELKRVIARAEKVSKQLDRRIEANSASHIQACAKCFLAQSRMVGLDCERQIQIKSAKLIQHAWQDFRQKRVVRAERAQRSAAPSSAENLRLKRDQKRVMHAGLVQRIAAPSTVEHLCLKREHAVEQSEEALKRASLQKQFLIACRKGNIELVELFLKRNVDVNRADDEHGTPLYAALMGDHQEVFRLLMEAGADFDSTASRLVRAVESTSSSSSSSCRTQRRQISRTVVDNHRYESFMDYWNTLTWEDVDSVYGDMSQPAKAQQKQASRCEMHDMHANPVEAAIMQLLVTGTSFHFDYSLFQPRLDQSERCCPSG